MVEGEAGMLIWTLTGQGLILGREVRHGRILADREAGRRLRGEVVVAGIGGGHLVHQEEGGADAVPAIRAIAVTVTGAGAGVGGDMGGDENPLGMLGLGHGPVI